MNLFQTTSNKNVVRLVLFILLMKFSGLYSQENQVSKHYPFVSLKYGYGNVIPTTDFVKGENQLKKPISNYQFTTVKIGWQNPGYKDWQKVYKGPVYGIGFYVADFFRPDEMGKPKAAFGFLGIPILRLEKILFLTEFQYGMAWNWNHYDPDSNPENLAIGSPITVYLDIGLNASFHLNQYFDLSGGISFTHFSNGGFERPNRGVNLFSPHVEVKYFVNGRPDLSSIQKPEKLNRTNELYFMLGYGDHQMVEHELDTNYFAVGGVGVFYTMQHSNAFRSGPGVDFNFWWALTALEDGSHGKVGWDNLTIGLIYQPELIVGRLALTGGFGIYARHKGYGNFNQTYQRLGARFHLTKNISLGVNVRAVNFMLAEFLEFNTGYRMNWDK
jgi:hypothetical protein